MTEMKKWKRVILIVFLTVVVGLVALFVWQYDNIMAVVKVVSNTNEEIAKEIDESKLVLEKNLKEQYPSVISDFTAEEERQIIKGELSVEEAVANLNKKYQTVKVEQKTDNTATSPEVDALIGDKVIELYSLKAYYLGQLGQMEAAVKKEYVKLPKEERNLVGKQALVNKYMNTALALLSQCDKQVEELLSELKGGLEDLNADTSIIKTIRSAYENEKTLKKAYYLSLLEE